MEQFLEKRGVTIIGVLGADNFGIYSESHELFKQFKLYDYSGGRRAVCAEGVDFDRFHRRIRRILAAVHAPFK